MSLIVYSKDNCPYCVLAKNLLTSLGAEYEEIDITATPGLIMDLVKLSGMRTVPQIFVGDECLGGYTDIASLHDRGELMGRSDYKKMPRSEAFLMLRKWNQKLKIIQSQYLIKQMRDIEKNIDSHLPLTRAWYGVNVLVPVFLIDM